MKPLVAKLVRQALFVVGGALGSKSLASDSDVEAIASALMVLGSLAWSWYNEWKKHKGNLNEK